MTIYYDKHSSAWIGDMAAAEHFLDYQTDYIRELVKHRGYIYLNQVYEILGVAWDTRCKNLVIENSDFTVITGYDCDEDRWVIDIY